MKNNELRKEIEDLIYERREGEYWDFKRQWYSTNADLIFDILCMANSLANRDCYIIIGVEDDTHEIIGVGNYNRKNQQMVIDLLRQKPRWAGGYIPEVYVRTIIINEKEVDILIIKKSVHTPFYLLEDYKNEGSPIYKGAIYIRKGDTNTPRTSTADIYDAGLLWKRRFGYDLRPSKRFKMLLEDYSGWSEADWDNIKQKYHLECPEYRISVGESKNIIDTISYFYDDEETPVAELKLEYFSTVLFETELWYMDMGRCIIPKPEWKYVIGKGVYYYFLKDSINGKLLGLLTNGKYMCTNRCNIEMPIMIFENVEEQKDFEEYFFNIDSSIISEIEKKIKEDAIMQHNLSREARYGKPEMGVFHVALTFGVYKKWKNGMRDVVI